MSDRGKPPGVLSPVSDPDYSTVLHAYVQLPLFNRQENGSWVASLRTFKCCELRLAEFVAEKFGGLVLRVELFDRRSQSVVDSRSCEELEDAVAAFKAMLPLAEAYAVIPCQAKWPEAP
ncbi:MAG TPA: hypothetical protein VH743_03475 [Beijerinckiaceae bacterium]